MVARAMRVTKWRLLVHAAAVAALSDVASAFTLGGSAAATAQARPHNALILGSCAARVACCVGSVVDAKCTPRAAAREKRIKGKTGGLLQLHALGSAAELKSTLRKYGLTALVTHFTQWCAWMVLLYSIISSVDLTDMASILPEKVLEVIASSPDTPGGLTTVTKLQLALAGNELIGPLRLGITLAISPKVSNFMRSYQIARDLEAKTVRVVRKKARELTAFYKAHTSNPYGTATLTRKTRLKDPQGLEGAREARVASLSRVTSSLQSPSSTSLNTETLSRQKESV